MQVAIGHWQGRVSPVLDTAGRFVLATVEAGQVVSRREVVIPPGGPLQRGRALAGAGAEAVVCGAVSRPLLSALHASGIKVMANVCGELDAVLAACATGNLTRDSQFAMPGCCRRRRRMRGGRRRGGRFGPAGDVRGDSVIDWERET